MRALFIIGAKIIGILCLYWAVSYFSQLAYFLTFIGLGERDTEGYMDRFFWQSVLALGMQVTLSLASGLILLLKTEKIADFLKITEDQEPSLNLSTDFLFQLGILLVGLYVLLQSLPQLGNVLSSYIILHKQNMPIDAKILSSLIEPCIKLCLAGGIVFYSKKVVLFFRDKERLLT